MDFEKKHSDPFFTKVFEMVFNSKGPYIDRPMRPIHEGSTVEPYQDRTTDNPNHGNFIFTLFHKRPHWFDKISGMRPFREETTTTPTLYPYRPPYWQPVNEKPHPDLTRPTVPPQTIQVVHSSGLEKCLWVALGGIAVVVLMAFFMKLGKPIRRVRRHLSNTRPAPVNPDGNLDMGSHSRLIDTNESRPVYNDPPPPYIECISISQSNSEEPPPRYSASFVDYKEAKPQVHLRLENDDIVQNATSKNIVRVESIAKTLTCNNSDGVASGNRTELVFNNGRIVERLSLNLSGNNNDTGEASNENVEEQSIPSNLLFKSRV